MIKISNRLKAVAALVSDGCVLADVGTDHGYVPIYLLQQHKIKKAIAMDINRGPLERAGEHINSFGMGEYIQTRLSDGVQALSTGEVQSILIAGMGGGLVIHILEAGQDVCQSAKELVLQPQSELERVRRFLAKNGYVTDAEDMVEEDGKYYPMMRVHYAPDAEKAKWKEEDAELFYLYGERLLRECHPVLYAYLKKEQKVYRSIYENLKKQPEAENITERCKDLEGALAKNQKALSLYEQRKKNFVK